MSIEEEAVAAVGVEIRAMRESLGAASETELAEMLGYSQASISQWRRRGNIPDKARRRFESYKQAGQIGLKMDAKRRELGHQVLYEGRCLAIFLAPSLDAAVSRRFSVTQYEPALREYTSFFDEIALACAEAIAARQETIEGNATDAFASLTKDDPNALYQRIISRAHQWRNGNAEGEINSDE